jgi:hypothetical protein
MSLDSTETSVLQTPTNYSREDLKPYLDYVEKEMNIMGVLSAFCALAPALAIKELLENIGPSPILVRFGSQAVRSSLSLRY